MNQQNIRNFAIIAHVDHGKSTLADRLLEITNTVPKEKMAEQFLDQNPISRERGITIKLAPVRMIYSSNVIPESSSGQALNLPTLSEAEGFRDPETSSGRRLDSDLRQNDNGKEYILNLIDTPGHVDFSYEVSRTLAACEGAILLVDATQGIQAQTVAHHKEALKENLTLVPVINKIDLPNAQTEIVAKELVETFGFKNDEILYISAKTGENVPQLIDQIIKRIPPPMGQKEKPLRALIFDAVYDEFRGVVAYIKVVDGELKKHDVIRFFQNNITSEVSDVGYFSPFLVSSDVLETGEIGYVITGIKDIRQCRIGDTITLSNVTHRHAQGDAERSRSIKGHMSNVEALPGYKLPKPMVFFGVYPKNSNYFVMLKESLNKLILNDTALTYTEEYSSYLGSGFRVGFLGLLHAEIVKERLKQEFNLEILLTMPQVLYKKEKDGVILEPYMKLSVYTPKNYVGQLMTVCQGRKGILLDMSYHDNYVVLSYDMPYSMFIRGLSSELKAASNGFASIDYELSEYKEADLAHLEVRMNDNPVDVLSETIYRNEASRVAREKASQLKNSLTRQQFRQIIQVMVDGNILAREEIPPFRKDVLQKMSGGDRRRKDKLLEAQKKGKSRLLSHAKVAIPQEALLSMIESS